MTTYRQHCKVRSVKTKFRCYSVCGYECLLDRYPELETFMDFDTWLTFYNADPDNWYCNTKWYIPYYHGSDELCHCIKFASRRDFRKFKRWYKKHLVDKDNEQNLKEQSALALMVRKAAAKRTEEAIQKQKQADDELQEIKDRIAAITNGSLYRVATNQNGPSVTFSTGQFRDETVPSKKKKKQMKWEYDPFIGEFYCIGEEE